MTPAWGSGARGREAPLSLAAGGEAQGAREEGLGIVSTVFGCPRRLLCDVMSQPARAQEAGTQDDKHSVLHLGCRLWASWLTRRALSPKLNWAVFCGPLQA